MNWYSALIVTRLLSSIMVGECSGYVRLQEKHSGK